MNKSTAFKINEFSFNSHKNDHFKDYVVRIKYYDDSNLRKIVTKDLLDEENI